MRPSLLSSAPSISALKETSRKPVTSGGLSARLSDEQILEAVRQHPSNRVKVAVTDLDGVLRGKYMHKDKFLSIAESTFGFCNVIFGWDSSDVCYDNGSYTGWHSGYPDASVKVDLSTYRNVPWDDDVPFFLGDFEDPEGNPLEICPRKLLRKIIARGESAGYKAYCGMEFEWFNFKETPQSLAAKNYAAPEPLTPGMFGYSVLRSSLNQPYFMALMEEMGQFRIPIEGLHTETGPGVFEAAILYSDALESADRGVLFKTASKEIAYRFGILPSFMAKWNSQMPGCSGHTHQSVWDLNDSQNLFHDASNPQKMSELFRSYLAGQIQALPEILPFFAPNVNSYKRLVDGFWAPTKTAWGVDNRTSAFRVIPGSSKSTRLETRVPGADVNPYLAVAACMASGLHGVEKNLSLKAAPIRGSAYNDPLSERLPRNLADATRRMADSRIANELFGEVFVSHFVKTREWEWRAFQDSVTSWELQRYLEIV
ncbi:MAG: glutamine synthetase [Methylotenera sp.]|nr:glutamine synthetase [Oligoflexia bacterium]